MLVSTTLALGFAWVARNAIVRLLADVRAQQLGAIMETIADLADEVDRERDHIPRSVDAPVTHDRLLAHQDALAPRGPGRLTPRSSHSMPISLSEGLRGRRFAARVAEDVPSPRRERRHGQADLLHQQPPSLRCPRSEDAESPSRSSPTLACPRLAGIRPCGRPHTKMGTARADTGSTPRNHARHGLRTQSRSRAMNAVGCRLSEFGLGTTDATAYRVAQGPAVPRKGRHWNFGTSDIS